MLLTIIIWTLLAILGCFTLFPIGNENSTVRRLPWVTFGLMALNVMIYYTSLPTTIEAEKEIAKSSGQLISFLKTNPQLLGDEKVREQLKSAGIVSEVEATDIENRLNSDLHLKAEYDTWLGSIQATKLKDEFDGKFEAFSTALKQHLYFKWGVAPNGEWRPVQLITWAFIHGGMIHLFGNMLFFFAVGFSIEDLWGRSLFLSFYLLAAIASALPSVIDPISVPVVGASGAVSAMMGAFLVRLRRTKIKVLCISIFFLLAGKKPYQFFNIAAFLYIPFYFVVQILTYWYEKRVGAGALVAYSAHFAGFIFGVAFAWFIKSSQIEEKHIHPKIEAKITFSAAPVITKALESLDAGAVELAERKLKSYLTSNPNDVNALLALIQVYQRESNFPALNQWYGRLIRHHLANHDKEAALLAYDNLLSAFPDDKVEVRIAPRDWLALCEYLRDAGMTKEAAVEYERMATGCQEDALAGRAAVDGGEAALAALDTERALRLFTLAQNLNVQDGLASRARMGTEKCMKRLANSPRWAQHQAKARALFGGDQAPAQKPPPSK